MSIEIVIRVKDKEGKVTKEETAEFEKGIYDLQSSIIEDRNCNDMSSLFPGTMKRCVIKLWSGIPTYDDFRARE